ncbi:major royal jelly protein [Sorangium cellulosum]|uniref:Major royal jelly protein n=1 Tax=Sorangium cellulosum TaxID=56 RepID=A0A2L0EHT4_SORCE|nr:L-dopachrome tautomerase-related protein [Sorangium cellulosum]AUX38851.1 major royal jelly protein [Sorangium cellulosum]
MDRFSHLKYTLASLSLSAALAACGGSQSPTQAPESTLEVYAKLDSSAVGGITQMPDGQVIIGFHPFYAPKVQVALLNPDRRSTTPYPSLEWQSCKNADGTWKSDFDYCLDWVLGLHTDQNGVLWMLDSARSTDKAAGRPAGLTPKLVAWSTKLNKLDRVIPITPDATLTESQHNDFVVDPKNNVIVIADEAIGEGSGGVGAKAALVVVDLATGQSRRLLQGHPSVMPLNEPIRWDVGQPTAGAFNLYVGVDGIALDTNSEWLYFAPLNATTMYRIRMSDILDTSLTPEQLGAKVETYADKPFNGGLSIDQNNNLYLTEVGERAVGIIPSDTRQYRRLVSDPAMVWPDGATYNSDGFMYTGAAQLPLASALQPDGVAKNEPPYLIYRFKPLAPGTPGF